MAIRKHPTKGHGWWQIVISHGRNKPQDVYLYQGSEAEARAYEADLRGVPVESTDQRPFDILGRYLSWAHLHRAARTATDSESTLPGIIETIGNKPLPLLRQADYNRYKAKRLEDGVCKQTVNIELTRFRSLLRFAIDELGLQPCELPKLYTKKQTAPPPKMILTPQEISRVLAQLHGDKKTIIILYAWCGLRRNEALTLQRKHIDLESGIINVPGKGGKHRIVPIIGDELLQRLLEACTHYPKIKRGKQVDQNDEIRPKKQDEYLFICTRTGKPYLNIKKSLKMAAKRAGITKPVWNHLLRHSGATAAISAGVNLRSLQTILGHGDIRMTEIYTHLSADMLKVEGAKMAAFHEAVKQTSEMSDSNTAQNGKVIQLHKIHRR